MTPRHCPSCMRWGYTETVPSISEKVNGHTHIIPL